MLPGRLLPRGLEACDALRFEELPTVVMVEKRLRTEFIHDAVLKSGL